MTKGTRWGIWTIWAVLSFLFIMSAVAKIMQSPAVVQGFEKVGISGTAGMWIGIVELSCLALYLIPRTAVTGTLLLTGYLGGAVMASLVGHNTILVPLFVGVLVWLGTWLRVPAFRPLVPLRQRNGSQENLLSAHQ